MDNPELSRRERPWEGPFDQLITELNGRWEGDILRPSTQREDDRAREFFAYPKLRAKVNRHNLEVEISDLPLSGSAELEGADNVKYLRLFVPCTLDHRVLIRHERLLDRVSKAFRLTWEFQTGAESFDRKYFLTSKKGQDLDWICQSEVQATIEALEPFTAVRIYEHGIQWSRELKGESDLDRESVAAVGEKLVDLSILLRENPF